MYRHVCVMYARHSREVKASIPCSSGAGRRGFDPRGVPLVPLSHILGRGPRTRALNWAGVIVRQRQAWAAPQALFYINTWAMVWPNDDYPARAP
jgi:hypothetical protein